MFIILSLIKYELWSKVNYDEIILEELMFFFEWWVLLVRI